MAELKTISNNLSKIKSVNYFLRNFLKVNSIKFNNVLKLILLLIVYMTK